MSHAASVLGLTNVTAVHARAEAFQVEPPFDTVVARAFAPLPRMLATVARLCGPHTQVLAMKGKWPTAELAALPAPWRVIGCASLRFASWGGTLRHRAGAGLSAQQAQPV